MNKAIDNFCVAFSIWIEDMIRWLVLKIKARFCNKAMVENSRFGKLKSTND